MIMNKSKFLNYAHMGFMGFFTMLLIAGFVAFIISDPSSTQLAGGTAIGGITLSYLVYSLTHSPAKVTETDN